MDNLENKLKEAILLQKKIEEKMKYIEDNSDSLTEQQLEELTKLVSKIEESLFPEVDSIKNEMEENKQSIFDKAKKNNEDIQD